MLKKCDLNQRVDEKTFKEEMEPLRLRLGQLQRELRDENRPVIIIIEGWNASGISATLQELIRFLDPRGVMLHSIGTPNDAEKDRPFLWRFWIRLPQRGSIGIFARGWYSRGLAENTRHPAWEKRVENVIHSINRFERQLVEDGTIIIKIFLHISKSEQKKRLVERESNPLTSWMITKGEWDFHNDYDEYFPVIDTFLKETDTFYAPWMVIGATDTRNTILTAYKTVIKALEKRKPVDSPIKHDFFSPDTIGAIRQKKDGKKLTKEEYQKQVSTTQMMIKDLQALMHKRKIPLIVVFEGRDAAGKGGTIMRLTHDLNPRGYKVTPVAGPNVLEKDYHYLWRFIRQYPRYGHITIYDRSWYGRVLVERVEGFCKKEEWKRAYSEINEMEEEFRSWGGGILKFWLEVSPEEQLKRFRERETDPLKRWKITEEDWRNREKWDQYGEAIEEMFRKTCTKNAPWIVIDSDDKWNARIRTLEAFCEYCERLLQ